MLNRRKFLGLVSGGATTIIVSRTSKGQRPEEFQGTEMNPDALARQDSELVSLSAVEVLKGLRSGAFSAEEYATALIDSFDRWAGLNAFISRDDDMFVSAARNSDRLRSGGADRGPLHGLPVLLKDNIETSALPTTAGTSALKDYQPLHDAAVAKALFNAGAILAGKANMHELAAGGPSDCEFGQVRNPYDRDMGAGGSSSGCGAALAARMVPAALGTDTGGSVRIPASLCGVMGLRPSLGRYPTAGIVPISLSRDTAGPMARSVADLALLDRVITGQEVTAEPAVLSGLRFGVPWKSSYAGLDKASLPVIEKALQILDDLGAELVEADIPGLQDMALAVREVLVSYEIGRDLPRYLTEGGSGVDPADFVAAICNPGLKRMMEGRLKGDSMPEAEFMTQFRERRATLQRAYAGYFQEHSLTAILFPTTILPARPVGQFDEVELNGRKVSPFVYNQNTNPGSAAGLPGLTIPAGLTAHGLPVGLAIDTPVGSDNWLLSLGAAIEVALPSLPAPTA